MLNYLGRTSINGRVCVTGENCKWGRICTFVCVCVSGIHCTLCGSSTHSGVCVSGRNFTSVEICISGTIPTSYTMVNESNNQPMRSVWKPQNTNTSHQHTPGRTQVTNIMSSSQLNKTVRPPPVNPYAKKKRMTHDEAKSSMMQTTISSYSMSSCQLKKPTPSLLNPYSQKQNKASSDEIAMTSVRNKTGETTGLDEYIRTLYRRFPSIDDTNGTIYLNEPGKSGKSAKNNRKTLSETALQGFLTKEFPQGAIHHTTNPETRARKHMNPAGQQLLFKEGMAARWDSNNMAKAAKEFELPGDIRIFLFFPEIFDREILKKYKQFDKVDSDGRKGVLTPCPWCKTNSHVKVKDKTGYKKGRHKAIADLVLRVPINCFIFECLNPCCAGDPMKADQHDSLAKLSAHSFHCYTPQVYANYPTELQEKYSSIM
jgi:hypothetical protein